ncbi:bifunctional protein-serine/threonine kinase/phosphatase [Sphingobium phenoxybenzoativorans]|jgi:serine/threonine protein phosphatase PrpC|uniref:Bifunctional protein-serine/threonine kinase/phosphatase n=1 Tax=Sphingobium phenoxybenzoativorans TaxID=1592790 RepID=A0A975KA52_9SPHN|nr:MULTISPECIES: bifunctional protein-serine/threonine kinase/phosphatase [Sphingobium]QUT07626.1 bifunctional protein-serine/threonine kinase/phosphatase [Sphingobium phenoxybenzoativorans]
MIPEGRLLVAGGHSSQTGARPENQDFVGIYTASELERMRRGMIAVVADGVGGGIGGDHRGGRIAAELAVREAIDGFYCQPDTIGVAAAVQRVMAPFNRWLCAMGRSDTMAHAATTFTACVLKGRKGHVLHVGDSRAWHFRDGRLTLLTEDHTRSHPDQRHILYRALGIEERLRLDHHEIALAEHDRILLTSDGVHGTLSARRIEKLLGARNSAEADAMAIVDAALAGGSQDNASAVVLDVVSLPGVGHDSVAGDIDKLPILPPPETGGSVDGFKLDRLLSDGRYTRLFRAVDSVSGQVVVVKFPKPALLSEGGAKLAFMREILVGSRISSPFVGGAIPVPQDRQSQLYGVQPYYEGQTLEQRLGSQVSLEEGLAIAVRLTRAVAALHKLDIIHRDIKPDNVILTQDGGLKLVDLGVARLPRIDEFAENEIPGTPSYLAPEMFTGNRGDQQTDMFALGVTLWRLFAGRYPYGEIEPFTRPRFRKPDMPSVHRTQLPAWLDAVLMRSVSIEPEERYGDAIELLRALEGGAAVARVKQNFVPLIERNPARFWQMVSLMLLAALIAALAMR